jgi:hypothetical protein
MKIPTIHTILVVAALSSLSGCAMIASTAAIAGWTAGFGAAGAGVAYELGDLEATYDATPNDVVRASREVFEEMGFHHLLVTRTSEDGELTAETADTDRKVKLRFAREQNLTRVWIRIGIFGDEALSREVYDRIRTKLGG